MDFLVNAFVAALLLPLGVQCITPEQMLSAPRYSAAKPNPSGEWAVYTSTSYSWEKAKAKTTWKLVNIGSGNITDLPYDGSVSEMVWVGETPTSVLYLNGSNDEVPGGVSLYTADLAQSSVSAKKVASLPAPYSGLKAAATSGGINFVLNAEAYYNNGSAYNPELASSPRTTGMLYSSNYVRHWDAVITQQRHAVFSGFLVKNSSGLEFDGIIKNLLQGIDAPITRPESPVGPYFDDGDYQLSPDGTTVVFLTKAPELPKANYTASYLYTVPHDGSSVAKKLNGPGSKAPEAAKGASGSPRWSPDGKKVAYFQLDGISYESDRAKIYVADVATGDISQTAADWDYSATDIQWYPDCNNNLWVAADYVGNTRLFSIPVDAPADFTPKNLTDNTQVIGAYPLSDTTALVSGNAIWSSYLLYTVTADGQKKWLYKANEHDSELAGLGPEDVDYFWYNGTLGDKQQTIIVKPEGFDPSKVYDLVFYVHGGPAGYTGNSWSTRWNLKTWADQGYVLIGPNPTGSTSYGQALCDRIRGEWGGLPYDDLVNAHKTACETLPYINCSNAVGAGASYGGFMMNWIQGSELGRQLKAIVSHDGIATTYADYSTDELWFIHTSQNGTLWDPNSTYKEWDPLGRAANFSTPEFIIHSEKDYRLPISEGLAFFNALQQQGVASRFLTFPDETHWVVKRENSVYWHHSIYDWINYYTGKVSTLNEEGVITQ